MRKHARLLAPGHARLEADEVVRGRGLVLGAELHDGVRPTAGARIGEPDGLHRTERERHLARATP